MTVGKSINLGVGLGKDFSHNLKIFEAACQVSQNNSSKIFLIGNKISIGHLSKEINNKGDLANINLIEGQDPDQHIFALLKNKTINAMVRGSISSSKFLKNVNKYYNVSEINRLAILETIKGHQFFYGPVGIDECNTFTKKIEFINKSLEMFRLLNLTPKISILSGGRTSDIGRDKYVDETIKIAEDIVKYYQQYNPEIMISHDEILIERAIEKQLNLIIAPDGISGNLIYRTLVHLGGGKAYGAIYMGIKHVLIDTSRVGNLDEIKGAILLAIALSP